MAIAPDDHFIRMKEVRQRTGLSRATIYRKIGEGSFPPNRKLGGQAVAWLNSEVQSWLDAQIEAEPAKEPWVPPPPPPRRIAEKKAPPLVPNDKGAEAAAKIAGVVGVTIRDGEVP